MQPHRRYGLLGRDISYSRSPELFRDIQESAGHPYSFELIDTPHLGSFIHEVTSDPHWHGFTVTTPYKVTILPFLTGGLTPTAQAIGAVNAVRRAADGTLMGHNTDAPAFGEVLSQVVAEQPHLRQQSEVLILGSGGAAKAVGYAVQQLGYTPLYVSRSPQGERLISYSALTPQCITSHQIIVHATPLGSAKHPGAYPELPYHYLSEHHLCMDLTYTPEVTPFMAQCSTYGALTLNGAEMLRRQAILAWRFFCESE